MSQLDSHSTRIARAKRQVDTSRLLALHPNCLRTASILQPHSGTCLPKHALLLAVLCNTLHYLAPLCTLLPLVLLLAATCSASDKNGVSPGSISLPKGPGSIEGLGESFQPNLNTGTPKYGISLKLPPGTAGHAPTLSLSYEGGGANGPLGYGWSLPTAYVQRRSDEGIPTYEQDVGFARQDSFINEMREELVPQTDGYYFCKNEGVFIRYQPVGDHWVATLPNGTRLEFGLSDNARIANGTNGQVFSWLLERETDTHGNVIVYAYSSFADAINQNQKYLSTIRYGPGAPPWTSYHFVSFEYEGRADWFEDCRSGFIVRTGKRLKTIRVGTQGVSLSGHLQGDFDGDGTPDYLDRAYQLTYLNYAGTNSYWSLLGTVTPLGADGVSTLPGSSFGYAVSDPADIVSAANYIIGSTNEPASVMDDPSVELVDLNGDGLPDILKTEPNGGAQQGFLNRGEAQLDSGKAIQWDSGMDVDPGNGTAWNYDLSSGDTHLADMDGDGLADLVHKTLLGDVFYFRNLGRVAWSEQQSMTVQDVAPPSPFGEADVRTADLDFDKRIDIVQSVASGVGYAYRIWFNLGNQTYSPSLTVDQEAGFDLSDPTVQLADMNGDRVPDIAQVRPNGVVVTAGLGYGHFAAAMTMSLPDYTLDGTQVGRAKLTDLNGDGLADLVIERAAPGECWYWLNLGNYSFSGRKVITGLPTTLSTSAVVRWADINGNGSTDLVYADQQASPRIQAVDLAELLTGGLTPNILVSINNGIGRVTTMEYQPSTRFALADAAVGQPWTNPMPLVVSVVASVTNFDSLGHFYVSRFVYHDGYYDAVEKQFRGFGRVEQVDVGDSSAPTLLTRSYFDTGRDYEVMKGKLLRLTTQQEDGKVFSDVTTSWTIPPLVLVVGTNGTNVSYAHPTGQQTQVLELGQGTARTLESEMDYDNYGNETRHADYGIVENGDRSAFNDERVTTTQYAINTNEWILRHPARQEIADENGVVLSRLESYYDDESFGGNNLGVVSVGNLTLSETWFNASAPSGYIKASRTKYDAFGNPVTLLDPLAVASGGGVDFSQGHVREVGYDNDFHAYAISETIHVGSGSQPLLYQAGYDVGFGTVIASKDFNSNSTSYGYDSFGRLISVVKPYDTSEYPTVEYDYALAVPYGTGGVVNYVESRQLDKVPGSAATKRDHYLISRQFTDGLGRALMSKQEAEPVLGSATPRVVVSGAVLFNARQKPSHIINPYFTLQSGGTLDDLLAYESLEAPGWQGTFHEHGQLVNLALGSAQQTSMIYDAKLRPTQVTNPDNTFRKTVYEPLVTKSYDENDTDLASPFFNTPTVQYHDGLDRLVQVDEIAHLNDDGTASSQLNSWTTSYQYDLNDCLIKITDSQENVRSMVFDGLRRKTALNDPDSGLVSYTYDDASNLKSTLDNKGQQILYTYDGANRILTEDYLDDNSPEFSYHRSPDVTYSYDLPAASVDNGDGTLSTAHNTKGMLAYVMDTSGEEHTSYDARGRVEWTIKRIPDPVFEHFVSPSSQLGSYRTQFQYDSFDRTTRVRYPDNDFVDYQYNTRGALLEIGSNASVVSNIVYSPSGQQMQVDYGDGVRTTYSYDRRLRLESILTTAPPSSLNQQLINFTYTFDGVSNIKNIQDQRDVSSLATADQRRNSQTFAYDDLYRLTQVQYNSPNSATNNGGQINYRYDRIGNMLAQTSDISQTEKGLSVANLGSMAYGGSAGGSGRIGRGPTDPPGPHALTQVSLVNSNRLYSYDANGNLTEMNGLKYFWDFKDRLVALEDNSMRADYTYDYLDRRITKRIQWKSGYSPPAGGAGISTGGLTTTIYVNKSFEVRDHEQPTKYVFNGQSRIASVIGSLSTDPRIQRIRLWSGWNLLSLAVDVSDLVGQLERNLPGTVQALYQWNPTNGSYLMIGAGQSASAGAVFWVKAATNATAGIFGTYEEPFNRSLDAGGTYVPCSGLEAWAPLLPFNSAGWMFDSQSNQWHEFFAGDLAPLSDSPLLVSPGQAMYVRMEAAAQLDVPDAALRLRYFHADHLTSSSAITDASGTLIEETAYYPFGCARNDYQPRGVEEYYKFCQKEQDLESGLDYFEARYFTPIHGRFASPDPLLDSERRENPQCWNRYAYSLNNPLRYIDPSGLYVWDKSLGGSEADSNVPQDVLSERKAIREALQKGLEKANDLPAGADKDLVLRGLNVYGKEGTANGVVVGMQASSGGHTAYHAPNATVTISPDSKGWALAGTLAHEGTHAADDLEFWAAAKNNRKAAQGGPLNRTAYEQEFRGYKVEAILAQATHPSGHVTKGGGFTIWDHSWKPEEIEKNRTAAINDLLANTPIYKLTPEKPGERILPRK